MYAMTQNQRSGRGQAVALDLVRAVLRAENMMTAIRHNEAMRARLSEDFGGYLVTDENPCDMTEAEMAACWPFGGRAHFEKFSERRESYAPRRVGVMNTGFPLPSSFGGDIDAPEWIASGAMFWADGVGPFPMARVRGES